MLEQLKLTNLALSNQAEVDFTPGMICITGETGAGKSLVVDALSLVLGAKADSNLVRQGQKQMEISALFSIGQNPQVRQLLIDYGFIDDSPKKNKKPSKAVKQNSAADSSSHPNATSPCFEVVAENSSFEQLSVSSDSISSNSGFAVIGDSDDAQSSGSFILEVKHLDNSSASNADSVGDNVSNSSEQGAGADNVQESGLRQVSETAVVADGHAVGMAGNNSGVEAAGSSVNKADVHAVVSDDQGTCQIGGATDVKAGSATDVRAGSATDVRAGGTTNSLSEGQTDGLTASQSIALQDGAAASVDGKTDSTHPQSKLKSKTSAAGKSKANFLSYYISSDLNAHKEELDQPLVHTVGFDSLGNAVEISTDVSSSKGRSRRSIKLDHDLQSIDAKAAQDNIQIGQVDLDPVSVEIQVAANDGQGLCVVQGAGAAMQGAGAVTIDVSEVVVANDALASCGAGADNDSSFDSEVDDDDESNDLILRRVVSAEGKSKAYINGHMATLGQLRAISECLVAIHGQHASVRLMDEKHQLEIVDNYGELKTFVDQVNSAFNNYSTLRLKLTKLAEEQKAGALAYKQDRYELEELKRLDLKEGDYEELEANFDKAMHQSQFMCAITNLYNLVEGSEANLVSLLRERLSELDKVKAFDPGIATLMSSIDVAIMNLYECSARAEELMSQDITLSSEELDAKMSKVHGLARRFGCKPNELYLMTEQLELKVEHFLGLKDKINTLTQEVKDSRQRYEDLCQELTLKRQEAAQNLAQQISERIKELALPDARFSIELTRDNECRPRVNGRDDLCFMFSANLGQELRPLSAVASGGELSRLALIIEVLTASVKSTPTLIFDEVDTGISGRTASAVGSLLKELGQYVQVITVTHLPQVAAKAHTQFVVAKFNEEGQVNSTISLLDDQGRIEEISRMIGGSVITETTRKSAYELLNDL